MKNVIKYLLDFECDRSVAGNCQDALKSCQEIVLQKMPADAEASFAAYSANYNSSKAPCDAKEQEQAQAQSTLDSADPARMTKRAAYAKLSTQRESSMCAFGAQAQAKCSAEAQY